MKLGSGAAKIREMLDHGVNVALGTDGGPSNNDYDLLREMKHAALLQTLRKLDPMAIRAEEVLEMATINGARALMIDNMVGSIEKGKRADIIVVDYWQPHLRPLNNPIAHLVFSATGLDVKHSIIDGKLVMYNREILTFNVDKVLEEADKAAYELYSRTGICKEPDIIWPVI